MTLARLGIGRLIVADFDTYSVSNLNRQMPAQLQDIGQRKTDIVASALQQINPYLEVTTVEAGITPQNADDLVRQSDAVITSMDGCAKPKACKKQRTTSSYRVVFCMTIVLQQALKRQHKMGLTASPMLNTVIATCFPPNGNYLSDLYPFDVDPNDLEHSIRQYYAWVEVMTKQKHLFQCGYFPVISPGTMTAAGFIGFHVVNYLARGDILFAAFPGKFDTATPADVTHIFDAQAMTMTTKHQSARLWFAVFRCCPGAKDWFVRRIKTKVERQLEME